LVFMTEPLPKRLEIMGAPRVSLRFASDKAQALIAVRLNDVAPDGASTRVTVGLLNLTHRFGHDQPVALTPGEMTEAVVEMDDIAHAFPAGHRIAVSLSTTYWPIAWPSPELATLTIQLGDSALHLPVRPANAADATLRVFDAPEAAAADDAPAIPPLPDAARYHRRVERNLLTGETVVDFPRWTYDMTMPVIGQTHRGTGLCRHTLTLNDPLTARCDTAYTVQIERPNATIRHESNGSLTCDATHFIVDMRVRLLRDGAEVFSRNWHERIPRDHM
jgi:uncharacterized protein